MTNEQNPSWYGQSGFAQGWSCICGASGMGSGQHHRCVSTLTEADVRRIVREEIRAALGKSGE